MRPAAANCDLVRQNDNRRARGTLVHITTESGATGEAKTIVGGRKRFSQTARRASEVSRSNELRNGSVWRELELSQVQSCQPRRLRTRQLTIGKRTPLNRPRILESSDSEYSLDRLVGRLAQDILRLI